MTAIGLLGGDGRMGRAIAGIAAAQGMTIAGTTGRHDGDDAIASLARAADVLIDFSVPDALDRHLDAAVAAGTPLLIGTTGLDAGHHAAIDRAAAAIAIVQAANTSLGIAVLRGLVAQTARALGPDWDIEIVEMHHRHKRDAPSGTALLLGAAAAEGRPGADTHLGHQSGVVRTPGDIHYVALRGGSVAGDHQVIFAGDGERIEIGHRAEGRAIFAQGAIRAARWLGEARAPGRYAMADVLGLA